MKRGILFLLLLSDCLYGQGNKFTLSGTITDCRTHDSIAGVTVKLAGSDGSSVETTTDYKGHYIFDDKRINNNRQYAVTTQVGNDVRNPKTHRGYLNSSDKIKLSTYDSVKSSNILRDFCLVENTPCTILNTPVLLFDKNSVEKYHFDPNDNSPYDTLSFFANFINDNSFWIFEIQTYTNSKEKHPEKTALLRAEYIKSQLVKLGVEEGRLKIKNYTDNDLAKKSSSAQNPRITFKIISTDYVPKNPPKEQPKTEVNEGEE